MELTIKIDSENEGATPEHVASVLESIARHVREVYGEWDGIIRDENGNKIGHWSVDSSDYVERLLDEQDAAADEIIEKILAEENQG